MYLKYIILRLKEIFFLRTESLKDREEILTAQVNYENVSFLKLKV